MVTDPAVNKVLDLLSTLNRRRDALEEENRQRLESLERQIEAVRTTLRLLGITEGSTTRVHDPGVPDLRGKMVHEQRLRRLAEAQGGVVGVTPAANLFIQQGVAKGKKRNLVAAFYKLLSLHPEWEHIGPGTFRLKSGPNGPTSSAAGVE